MQAMGKYTTFLPQRQTECCDNGKEGRDVDEVYVTMRSEGLFWLLYKKKAQIKSGNSK